LKHLEWTYSDCWKGWWLQGHGWKHHWSLLH